MPPTATLPNSEAKQGIVISSTVTIFARSLALVEAARQFVAQE
ncbi:hypothetical protein [Deinococcus altitudinis]